MLMTRKVARKRSPVLSPKKTPRGQPAVKPAAGRRPVGGTRPDIRKLGFEPVGRRDRSESRVPDPPHSDCDRSVPVEEYIFHLAACEAIEDTDLLEETELELLALVDRSVESEPRSAEDLRAESRARTFAE